jgi:hypothetical protein
VLPHHAQVTSIEEQIAAGITTRLSLRTALTLKDE